jgi:hypothetical protein
MFASILRSLNCFKNSATVEQHDENKSKNLETNRSNQNSSIYEYLISNLYEKHNKLNNDNVSSNTASLALNERLLKTINDYESIISTAPAPESTKPEISKRKNQRFWAFKKRLGLRNLCNCKSSSKDEQQTDKE